MTRRPEPTRGGASRFLLATFLLMSWTGLVHGEIIDRILAVVAGQVITLSDVRGIIELGLVTAVETDDPYGRVLTQLIERQLMLAEVDRYAPPEPDSSLVEQRVDAIRGRFGSQQAFAATLAVSGMSDDRVRQIVRDDLRIQAYLDQRFAAAAQPTDEEIVKFYREHEADYRQGGVTPPLTEVREMVRSRLAFERRQVLISDWVTSLRRRAEVTMLYLPQR